jgi:hypothetical protein
VPRPGEHVAEIEVLRRRCAGQLGGALGRCARSRNIEPVHQSVDSATGGEDAGGMRSKERCGRSSLK